MAAKTHYMLMAGDGHMPGNSPLILDPRAGQRLDLLAAPPIPLNAVLRGTETGNVARVTRIYGPGNYALEMLENAGGTHAPGTPGLAWSNGLPIVETINIDTGGTAIPSPLGNAQSVQLLNSYLGDKKEAEYLTFTPDDPTTDTVLYDRFAKVATELVVPTVSISPASPAIAFVRGDRVEAASGGTFTVLYVSTSGSNTLIRVIRKVGPIANGDGLTNLTRAASATVQTVGAEQPIGSWIPHAVGPNFNGTATTFETIPWGGINPIGSICRAFWEKWKVAPDADDRGVRVVPFNTFDHYSTIGCTGTFPTNWVIGETITSIGGYSAKLARFDATTQELFVEDVSAWTLAPGATVTGSTSGASVATGGAVVGFDQALSGGVTVQTVQCSGTFPTTWQQGEIVVDSTTGFEGRVQGFNAARKLLFVYGTNGLPVNNAVVAPGSGSAAVALGPAYGWQKGSRYWTRMLAEITEAQSRQGALYNGSAAEWYGAILLIWETELATFNTILACPWPTIELMVTQWVKLINDLRAELGDPDLPVALFHMDIRSHLGDITAFGGQLPFSYLLRECMARIPKILPRVALISTDGMQPGQTTALPYTLDLLRLRTDDYWEVGKRAWRAIEFLNFTVPTGENLEPLVLILMLGFSFINGSINAGWGFADYDPDLYPSTGFPGVNTLDDHVLNFNANLDSWQPYDVANNANSWLGSFGFGLEASLSLRAKKRFAIAPATTAKIGLIKVAYNGASANGAVRTAPATFDPNGAVPVITVASCTVTVIPANSNNAARGRFTATPGTFSAWQVNAFATVQGSALGMQGSGGNNSQVYLGGVTRAVAVDGSYAEIEGSFVAEGPRSFTLTQGPYPLWPEVEKTVRRAIVRAVELGYMPKPGAVVTQLGVVDLERVDEFQDAYTRIHEGIEKSFCLRFKGEDSVPVVIFEDTPKTPWPSTDEQVETLILAQRAVAASLPRAVSIDTSRLPMESGGIWPRTDRFKNGVHTTPRGYIAMGYMADAALEALGFPAHPDGPAMIEYGTPGGGVIIGGGAGPVPVPAPGFPGTGNLIVEDGTGVDDAESLASVEDLDDFWAKNGSPSTVTGATDVAKAAALRKATREWVVPYSRRLRGGVQYLTQRLPWPRLGSYDDEGRVVASGTVPQDFKDATCLVAGEILAGLPILVSEVDRGQVVRETRKGVGFEKTTEYAAGSGGGSSRRRIPAAEALIYPYVDGGESEVYLS